MYKSKLQEQKQWALPRYTSMKYGPDHTPCFKSSVSLNGESFNSSTPCKSGKDSQNDAAKSAFLHFTSSAYSLAVAANPNPVQQVDLGIYKDLLRELTEKQEWSLPEYKTIKCGVPHKPTFFSTVEVEDDLFYGNGAKSKKEAEMNAAKAAYTNLTQRKTSFQIDEVQEVKSGEKEGSTCCDISDLSISDSKEAGLRSYLLNNRFRVYPFYPDIAFPQGITVLPISEDKWVAVSLEFPNERDD